MRSKVEESFTDFFEKWMAQLEECAHSLLIENEKDHDNLVNKMTTHYKNYYTAKWAAAREDVLAFFAPVWLTSLESAYVWVTGWKPSTAFRLVPRAGMSEEQAKKVEILKAKIKAEEEKVEREMERQQVAVADRRMVMKMADCVRLKTLKGLLDVLGPTQSVHFLASASMLQIQMRKCGKTLDSLRRTKASSAHQSGNSLGTATSGEISRTFLSFSITSLMVGLFLGQQAVTVQNLSSFSPYFDLVASSSQKLISAICANEICSLYEHETVEPKYANHNEKILP
nr:protein DOG1-like 4 [Ipomoea batatas]